jgi:hypothetical protein
MNEAGGVEGIRARPDSQKLGGFKSLLPTSSVVVQSEPGPSARAQKPRKEKASEAELLSGHVLRRRCRSSRADSIEVSLSNEVLGLKALLSGVVVKREEAGKGRAVRKAISEATRKRQAT